MNIFFGMYSCDPALLLSLRNLDNDNDASKIIFQMHQDSIHLPAHGQVVGDHLKDGFLQNSRRFSDAALFTRATPTSDGDITTAVVGDLSGGWRRKTHWEKLPTRPDSVAQEDERDVVFIREWVVGRVDDDFRYFYDDPSVIELPMKPQLLLFSSGQLVNHRSSSEYIFDLKSVPCLQLK